MDIQVYEDIFNGLVEYNRKVDEFETAIVPYPTTDTTFPFVALEETRNVADQRYNTCFNRVSSVGYKVEIYAKDIGTLDKQTIARKKAKQIDDYMTNNVGLTRIAFATNNLVNDASQYRITMTYNGTLFENRRKFI